MVELIKILSKQEAFYYGLEQTIYRISVSPYASYFVLKGSIFLYAIFDRKYERATADVNLLARRISNSAEEMKVVFRDFLLRTPTMLLFSTLIQLQRKISEFKEYHGLHLSAVAYLDRTRIPIGIDIGFDDVIYPDAVKMEFPMILDMEASRVNAYSLESSTFTRGGKWSKIKLEIFIMLNLSYTESGKYTQNVLYRIIE